jgi:acyl transferase domain-containing protein/surfactin synthase thioesterase subunit/acyl carrier protein
VTDQPQDKLRSTLMQALREVERLRRKVAALENPTPEPIAIVGVGLRLPGGAEDLDSLWQLLDAGTDTVAAIPSSRWPVDEFYDPDPEASNKSYVREAALLDRVDLFDPGFFNISPREAKSIDPQHRLLLEASWEALEFAGVIPGELVDSPTGVFVGIGPSEYAMLHHGSADAFTVTGTHMSFAAGRVAFTLGLQGPAVSIDTACSSSLVALHLASQSLRAGECSLALAAGVQVLTAPDGLIALSQTRAVAPDGRSKTFSDRADGYGRGEGVVALALERLADARAKGHPVLGIVRGSAVVHDGRSSGITAPNGTSQQKVIRAALASARLEPAEVDYVECHGTGTSLGDPIEVQALASVYGQRPAERPLLLGAVKTNIGHLESAAGLAGVAKVLAALRHEALPPTIHTQPRNHHIEWSELPVEVVDASREWPESSRPRRAGISAFGLSGTNAHVIIEAAEVSASAAEPERPREQPSALPLVLHARSEEALRGQAARLAGRLAETSAAELADVCFSLLTTRSHFEHRLGLAVTPADARAQLDAVAAGDPPVASVLGSPRPRPKLALLLTGQGAQHPGMGRQLAASYPRFATELDAICERFDPLLDRPLRELMFAAEGSSEAAELNRTVYTQPALFAFELALFRMLEAWGVRPSVLLGHSIGELVAAHIAGVLSLDDACKLVAARGRMMQALPEGGAMCSIQATEAEILAELERHEGVDIAGLNGPMSTVISGDEAPVAAIEAHFAGLGRKTRRLRVSHAFHSHRMDGMLAEFEALAASLELHPAKIPIVSNVTGELADPEQLRSPAYWARHVRAAVRFAEGVATLEQQRVGVCLEIGPRGVLSSLASACLSERDGAPMGLLAATRPKQDEAVALALALAGLQVHGAGVDWPAYFEASGARRVELPTYAFARARFWLDSSRSRAEVSSAGLDEVEHPLLGAAVQRADADAYLFTTRLSVAEHPWLRDHAVFDRVVLPGTAYLDLCLSVGARIGTERVEELTIEAPLVLDAETKTDLQLAVEAPSEAGERELSVYSRPAGEAGAWVRHVRARLSSGAEASGEALDRWPPRDAEALELDQLYPRLAEIGLGYGPCFQGAKRAWRRGESVYVEVELPRDCSVEGFALHPALLDAALHPLALDAAEGRVALPFAWSGVSLHASGASALRVRLTPDAGGESVALAVADAGGAALLSVEQLRIRHAEASDIRAASSARGERMLYRLAWQPSPSPSAPRRTRVAAVHASEALAEELGARALAELAELEPEDELVIAPFLAREQTALDACAVALELLQNWLAEERFATTSLVIVTRRAVAAEPGESLDLDHAPIWGLVRSAQSEHPEHPLFIVDIDDETPLSSLASLALDEPQLALRGGRRLIPRLERAAAPSAPPRLPDADASVLITGATGALGSLLARHLVEHHGVRSLVLCSRRGPEAPGAAELVRELEAAGAEVHLRACELDDRSAVAELLASVPEQRPLGMVVHAAGVVDDGVIERLDRERLRRVFAPKLDGARILHELTASSDLAAFVLFSSAAGVVGAPGQGNYAAANTYLDALASERQARGLNATSIAWGPWASEGMLARLGEADRARLRRQGVRPLDEDTGLRLFDAALASGLASPCAIDLDLPALARRDEELAPVLRALVPRKSLRRAARGPAQAGLRDRLAALDARERERLVIDLVRSEAALVLGQAEPSAVPVSKALQELGLDSLMAVELRNRLQKSSGLELPATLLFDYPSVAAVAQMLVDELTDAGEELAAAPEREHDDEPIAIVAMSCRYPGGVDSPEAMWQLLAEGRDGIGEFPRDRGWPSDIFSSEPDARGKSSTHFGGFLYDAANFDPGFFGISPREAIAIDPQQRLLLEVAWEAFERAGVSPEELRGSKTGVFVGIMYSDYGGRLVAAPESLDGYVGIGSSPSVASGRISYTFGLEGPALTVDTACSSSLVAMHLAAQALARGECDLALAGGATVMASPAVFIEFSRQRGLSPDGRCKSFSAAADGVGWGEGAGVVVLERLGDARRKGHEVLAILRGSAVNQDGRSQGLTAPNGRSQQRVIRAALASAGLEADEVDAVEAHGTGTRLGDPIEAQALLATYGRAHTAERPLWLGSIKSNIGHTQAAAGVAGIIKMILAMQHERLPASLHAATPTPEVDWSSGHVELLREARPWSSAGARRAAVSSFGISGTNAHIILEQAPAREAPSPAETRAQPGYLPLVISGSNDDAVRAVARQLRPFVAESVLDTAASLHPSRANFERRAVVVADSPALAEQRLEALAEGHGAIFSAREHPKLALLFTGQGSQRAGMGRQLHARYPAFAASFDAIAARFDAELDRPLRELMFEDESGLIDQTRYTQPALFTLEVALFRLLESLGVRPQVLLGHSIGELAAAHVAGVLDLDDACTLVAARGRLMQALPAGGAMVALEASEAEVLAELEAHPGLDIAGLNGPNSTVVSGDEGDALRLAGQFEGRGRRVRRLAVSHAFHSRHMEPMLDEFRAVAASVSLREPQVAIVSNLSGRLATAEELTSPDYWVRHVRQAVRFLDGVRELEAGRAEIYLELGPHGVLSSMAAGCLSSPAALIPTLRRDRDETEAFAQAIGELHCHGGELDWSAYFEPHAPRPLALPTYPFQRKRYWLAPPPPSSRAQGSEGEFDQRLWDVVEGDDGPALAELLRVEPSAAQTMLAPLHEIAAARSRRSELAGLGELRYRVDWQRLPAPAGELGGSWLLLVPAALREHSLVRELGSELARAAGLEPARVVVEGGDRQQLAAELAELPVPHGVLSLLLLDDALDPEHPALSRGLVASLAAAQALGDAGIEAPLWILSRGAVAASADDPPVRPEQSAGLGFGRVLGLEQPERWGGMIDLDPTGEALDGSLLSALLAGPGRGEELAIRGGAVYGRRLVRARLSSTPRPWRARGPALITGGTGGLGSATARWLVDRGVEQLILASRRGEDSPRAAPLREELEALGAKVRFVACDVRKREALAAVLTELEGDGLGPRIVVHTAGESGELTPVTELSVAELAAVAAGKILGARNLHELTADTELEAFVCFASISGVWGGAQQAAYSAANAYLDGLAARRVAEGREATSLAWGPWSGAGMLSREHASALQKRGIAPLEPEPALESLGLSLALGDVAVTIADIDWSRFAPLFAAQRSQPLLAELPEAQRALRSLPSPERLSRSLARLSLGDLQRAGLLDAVLELLDEVVGEDEGGEQADAGDLRPRVIRLAAAVLTLEPGEIEASRPLTSLGLDSLMAVELRTRLEELGLEVPVASLLQGASIDDLLRGSGSASTELAPASSSAWLDIEVPAPEARLRLIAFPYAGGGPAVFKGWGRALGPEVEVVVAHFPGRGSRLGDPLVHSIDDLVEPLVEALLPLSDRPMAMFGHCMGAVVMAEVAGRLQHEHGVELVHVFASAAGAPSHYQAPLLHVMDDELILLGLSLIGFTNSRVIAEDAELRELMMPTLRADFEAVSTYSREPHTLRTLSAPITAIAGLRDMFAPPRFISLWSNYTTSDFSLRLLDEKHYFVESQRDLVLDIIRASLPEFFEAANTELRGATRVELPEWDRTIRPELVESDEPIPSPSFRELQQGDEHGDYIIMIPDVFAGSFPVSASMQWPSGWHVLELGYPRIEGRASPAQPLEVIEQIFAAVAARVGERRVVLLGHGFGAICAAEIAQRVPSRVIQMIAANAVPPGHYGLPFTDLADRADTESVMHFVGHPDVHEADTDQMLSLLQLASNYPVDRSVTIECPITVVRARRSAWFSFHTSRHWREVCAETVDFIDHEGNHFTTIDDLVEPVLRAVCGPGSSDDGR